MQQALTKWADYVIMAARYDSDRKHIAQVEVKVGGGYGLGASFCLSREEVVRLIGLWQRTFQTAIRNEIGWQRGEDVHLLTIRGNVYIRTDSNCTAADNLGSLPEF